MAPAVIIALITPLGAYREEKDGQEYRFRCPYCRQPKQYLSVNPVKKHPNGQGVFRCWFCGSHGSLAKLCRRVGVAYEDALIPEVTDFDRAVRGILSDAVAAESVGRLDYSLEPGEDYFPDVPSYTRAYAYLTQKRKLTDEDIRRYRFGLGKARYRNRIILPEFVDDQMTFYQARSYDGREPRYLSPAGNRDWHVWNLDRVAALYDSVVISEGIFSAIACGDNSVALYSYNYLPGQVSLLVDASFDEYVIAFDGQVKALIQAYALATDLLACGVSERRVRLAILPFERDPDDLGKDLMQTILRNAVGWRPDFMYQVSTGEIGCPIVN